MAALTLVIDAVLEDDRRVPLAEVQARRRFVENDSPGPAALVSAVVTVSGPDTPVDRAVKSILAQTYPNFEVLVVVPGGKSPGAELAHRYPGIAVVEGGPGAAASRNAGLRQSKGSMVVFLDVSERLAPNAFELGLDELAAQSDCAFVSGKCTVTRPYHTDPEYPQQPLITNDNYAYLLGRNYILSPAAAIFRRAALEAVGGFDETLEMLDDYDLYLRVARDFRIGTHSNVVAESPAPDSLRTAPEQAVRVLADVLGRQQNHVSSDPDLRRKFQLGKQAWGDRYGLSLGERSRIPASGSVDFGSLRRLAPLSTNFGYDRGTPVDRRYIETFLADHAEDVRGRVLEVQENDYTTRFGGERLETSEVLSLLPDNPKATIVGDLSHGDTIPTASLDCAIVTQVLHLIHDPRNAVRTLHRILRPDGVALVTVPGISQLEWSESWHWSFTVLSAKQMFDDVFGRHNVQVRAYGNVLAATAFLWGIAAGELEQAELDYFDPNYPVTVAVRAVRSSSD